MSAAIRRENDDGVVLRYLPDVTLPASRGPQASDFERVTVLRAERELRIVESIHRHLELSIIGHERLEEAIAAIFKALAVARRHVRLAP